ncbi:MAG: hypothetical protein OXG53_06005 [Chloroflexi bacterium]|nr:hypothetical protein [Chloroflexota bacterium]
MHISNVRENLDKIRRIYRRTGTDILGGTAKDVLDVAEARAVAMWDEFKRDKKRNPDWGYDISEAAPLRFKPSRVLKDAIVDVYCKIRWSEESSVPCKQDIKVRVWSEDSSIIYRSDLDSECVEKELTDPARIQPGRVISRFHFDRANLSNGSRRQYHPEFHVQIGGIPGSHELCWHPKGFNLPRIPYQPMELLMTCQLVAINFFPAEYGDIAKEPDWKDQLHSTQKLILLDYYQLCRDTIWQKDSLLDRLRA